MDSKQRRKDRKARALIKFGRNAQVELAAAQQQVDGLSSELAERDDRLRRGMHAANDLEEAFIAAEAHVVTLKAEHEEEKRCIHQEHAQTKQRMEQEYSEALSKAEERAKMAEAQREAMRAMVAEPEKLRKRLREKQLENDRLLHELNLALQKPTEAQPIVILSAAAERAIAERDAVARATARSLASSEGTISTNDSLGRVLGTVQR